MHAHDQRFNTLTTQELSLRPVLQYEMGSCCFHRPPFICSSPSRSPVMASSLKIAPSRSPQGQVASPHSQSPLLTSADKLISNRQPVRRNLFGYRSSSCLPEHLAAGLPSAEHTLCPTDQSDAAQPTLLAFASNDAASSCASQVVAFIVARLSLSGEQAVQPGLDEDLLRNVLSPPRDQVSRAELQSLGSVELLAQFLCTRYPVTVRQVRAGFTLTVLSFRVKADQCLDEYVFALSVHSS